MEFDRVYGRSGGSCFGVTDPSRLRPVFNPLPSPIYTLVYRKKPNQDRKVVTISAVNNADVIEFVKKELNIRGVMTVEKFRKAGAKAIVLKGNRIFPK